MTMDDLKGRTLNLSVWHNDSRGRNVFLGQVAIDLKTWDWGHETLTWYNLQPKVNSIYCIKVVQFIQKETPQGSLVHCLPGVEVFSGGFEM